VAADNDHPEESWLLVNFLTNEAGAERVATGGFGPMPSRTAASATWIEMVGENGQAFVDGSEFAVAPVTPAGYGDFRTVLGNGLGDAFRGDADAIDVLDETAEAAADAAAG
jgi:ABC-type glycerol-3-phosphate transport system substrate-binding protein